MQKTRNLINMVIKMYTRLTRHQTGAGAGAEADRRCEFARIESGARNEIHICLRGVAHATAF